MFTNQLEKSSYLSPPKKKKKKILPRIRINIFRCFLFLSIAKIKVDLLTLSLEGCRPLSGCDRMERRFQEQKDYRYHFRHELRCHFLCRRVLCILRTKSAWRCRQPYPLPSQLDQFSFFPPFFFYKETCFANV